MIAKMLNEIIIPRRVLERCSNIVESMRPMSDKISPMRQTNFIGINIKLPSDFM